MFNAISRHKLREIVQEEFPRLTAFVDCLYEEQGKSMVKMDDGSWEEIPVCEVFSQGCPLCPILAAIVLNHILKHVDSVLQARSSTCSKSQSDDGMGGLATIMAYVDDANFLVPLEDVKPLLEAFKEVAEPLGAKMNEEKTRIPLPPLAEQASSINSKPPILRSMILSRVQLRPILSTKMAQCMRKPMTFGFWEYQLVTTTTANPSSLISYKKL